MRCLLLCLSGARQWRACALWSLLLLRSGAPVPVLPAPAPDLSRLPPAANRPTDYIADVRPILQANCYGCHGPDKQKSDLRLDGKAAALAGGQRGPAIVPGRSAESTLILYTAGLVEDMQMPPAKGGARRLTPEEIGVLRSWIDGGAHWAEGADVSSSDADSARSRVSVTAKTNWWVFQPAVRPMPSPSADRPWCRNQIDGFILDRLDRESLTPSPEADKRTLLRRVSFDLTGLLPSP